MSYFSYMQSESANHTLYTDLTLRVWARVFPQAFCLPFISSCWKKNNASSLYHFQCRNHSTNGKHLSSQTFFLKTVLGLFSWYNFDHLGFALILLQRLRDYIRSISVLVLAFLGSRIFHFLVLTEAAYFNMFTSDSETVLAKTFISLHMFESPFYSHLYLIDSIVGLEI